MTKLHPNDPPLKLGLAEIFLGPVSTQFGLVGLATFSLWVSQIKKIGVPKNWEANLTLAPQMFGLAKVSLRHMHVDRHCSNRPLCLSIFTGGQLHASPPNVWAS